MSSNNLKSILENFEIETNIEPYGNGHINDTYLCESNPGYILQRININVFKHPDEVMKNIVSVTRHLRSKIEKNDGDPERETLNVVRTKTGKDFYMADSDNYYRMYKYWRYTRNHRLCE